jgi:hypothetical protein
MFKIRFRMANIEWAQLCELAFIDSRGRLCLIGITNRFPVPSLPLAVPQLMLAARVVDARHGEEFDIGVTVVTPRGLFAAPNAADGCDVVMAGEHVLITLRDLPLSEEGVYRFEVSLGDGRPITLEVPVWLVSTPRFAEVH